MTHDPEDDCSPRRGRIPLPEPAEMSEAQLRVHDEIVSGRRGVMVGPLRAVIHNPELAERWSRLGEYLRYNLSVPARQRELAIIATGRRWSSLVEWTIHARTAEELGVPQVAIDAIRNGEPPRLEEPDDALVYEFTRQLQMEGQVALPAYAAVRERWGDAGVVELTALVGYYTMVALMLNAHEIPAPDASAPALPGSGNGMLFALQPAADRATP